MKKNKWFKFTCAAALLASSAYAVAEGCGPWWCKIQSTSPICNCQVSK